jgi:hypothetical protein
LCIVCVGHPLFSWCEYIRHTRGGFQPQATQALQPSGPHFHSPGLSLISPLLVEYSIQLQEHHCNTHILSYKSDMRELHREGHEPGYITVCCVPIPLPDTIVIQIGLTYPLLKPPLASTMIETMTTSASIKGGASACSIQKDPSLVDCL